MNLAVELRVQENTLHFWAVVVSIYVSTGARRLGSVNDRNSTQLLQMASYSATQKRASRPLLKGARGNPKPARRNNLILHITNPK